MFKHTEVWQSQRQEEEINESFYSELAWFSLENTPKILLWSLGLRSLISFCFLISRDLCFISGLWQFFCQNWLVPTCSQLVPERGVSQRERAIEPHHFLHPGRLPSLAFPWLTTERKSKCPFLSFLFKNYFIVCHYHLQKRMAKRSINQNCVSVANHQAERVVLCSSSSYKTSCFPSTLLFSLEFTFL